MQAPPIIPIGSFIEGMDSLHAEDDPRFAPVAGTNGYSPPRRCISAVNADLDDLGRPRWRSGTTQRVAATSGLGVFCGLGMAFFQDEGTIKRITDFDTWTTESTVTGLNSSAVIIFHVHNNRILWDNGIETGQIDSSGTASSWGLATAPTPTLGTDTGTLAAGTYLVSSTFEDAAGVEHAAGPSAEITLSSIAAITFDLSSVDANAVNVKIYASKPNGEDLCWCKTVAVGSLPTTITDASVDDTLIPHQHISPPIPGDGIFSYGGLVIMFEGRYLRPSYGEAIHLFEIDQTEEDRPSDILAGGGLKDGFWTICEDGAFWTVGGLPEEWDTKRKDSRKYAKGAMVLPGSLLPALKTTENVALFVSEDGLMVGMPDGSLIPWTDDKHRLDVEDKTASIVFFRNTNFNQILFTLE